MLFDWRGEDSGPNVNSAADVLRLYAQARAKFPNAAVRAGGLDDVAESLLRPAVRSKLPVLALEVGDTWSYGIQSDPRKVANIRAAARHRAGSGQDQQPRSGSRRPRPSPNPQQRQPMPTLNDQLPVTWHHYSEP